MSKLYFKYGTMGAGKTETLLNILYDYEVNNDFRCIIVKPRIDNKGKACIVSRSNRERIVDILSDGSEDLYYLLENSITSIDKIGAIFIDEAQFLSRYNVQQLHKFAHEKDIPVFAFGIRVDVYGEPFMGATYLFALADNIEEIGTRKLCSCGKKATKHIRFIDDEIDESGKSIVIDADAKVEYKSLCSKCWLRINKK